MKDNVNKRIEKITDKLLREATMESPSIDFTAKVMSEVQAISKSNVTAYRPLISKRVWTGVLILALGLVVYSFFGESAQNDVTASVDLSIITNNMLTNALSSFSFSKTLLYTAGIFAIMFAIQVAMLKGYFDRRLGL